VRQSWAVLIPVKATRRGKSRVDLDPAIRQELALDLALDTTSVALATPQVEIVLAVVEDGADGVALAALGANVLVTPTRELNAALRDGLSRLSGHGGPVAVLPGDLPGITVADLGDLLTRCAPLPAAVVPDAQGTGTTVLTARLPVDLHPRYGPGSFARHVAGGAVPIDLPTNSTLRHDVDTVADLPGVGGRRTSALVERLGPATVGNAARSGSDRR
jgi:2-phospho-L-lactate guanylyltransferase